MHLILTHARFPMFRWFLRNKYFVMPDTSVNFAFFPTSKLIFLSLYLHHSVQKMHLFCLVVRYLISGFPKHEPFVIEMISQFKFNSPDLETSSRVFRCLKQHAMHCGSGSGETVPCRFFHRRRSRTEAPPRRPPPVLQGARRGAPRGPSNRAWGDFISNNTFLSPPVDGYFPLFFFGIPFFSCKVF